MIKERVGELDRLVTGAITDYEELNDRLDGRVLEFWRGAKMIVDDLKVEIEMTDASDSAERTLKEII